MSHPAGSGTKPWLLGCCLPCAGKGPGRSPAKAEWLNSTRFPNRCKVSLGGCRRRSTFYCPIHSNLDAAGEKGKRPDLVAWRCLDNGLRRVCCTPGATEAPLRVHSRGLAGPRARRLGLKHQLQVQHTVKTWGSG